MQACSELQIEGNFALFAISSNVSLMQACSELQIEGNFALFAISSNVSLMQACSELQIEEETMLCLPFPLTYH